MDEWSIYQSAHGWALARTDWSGDGAVGIPHRGGLDKKERQMAGGWREQMESEMTRAPGCEVPGGGDAPC